MIEIPDWADTIGDADLIAFVKARLDEDEAAAEAVFAAARLFPGAAQRSSVLGHQVFDGTGIVVTHDRSVTLPSDVAAFIARYDPARAVREVEAKHRHLDQYRMAVAACQLAPAGEARGLESYRAAAWGAVLSDAAVWCEHPEYQAKWKP